jgi:hypothetical protein
MSATVDLAERPLRDLATAELWSHLAPSSGCFSDSSRVQLGANSVRQNPMRSVEHERSHFREPCLL